MLKLQWVLLLLAFFFMFGLFLLPKSVVNTRQTAIKGSQEEKKATTAVDSTQQNAHGKSLSSQDQKRVAAFKSKLTATKQSDEAKTLTDSLNATFRRANFFDSAAFYVGELAKRFPTQANGLAAGDAWYEAAKFALDKQKTQTLITNARKNYEAVLKLAPNSSEAKVKLGTTYVMSENPMQGIMMIREVLAKEPDNSLAIFNLGIFAIESGQFDKAVERFQHLVRLEPNNTQAQFYLALSLAETGNKKEAIALFEHLKNTQVDAIIAAAIDDYLAKLKN